MSAISKDISSLSDFERDTAGFIRQLKESGDPVVLTVNGQAEVVIQDAASYQKLLDLVERARELEITRRALAEADAGLGRTAAAMSAEMRESLGTPKGR